MTCSTARGIMPRLVSSLPPSMVKVFPEPGGNRECAWAQAGERASGGRPVAPTCLAVGKDADIVAVQCRAHELGNLGKAVGLGVAGPKDLRQAAHIHQPRDPGVCGRVRILEPAFKTRSKKPASRPTLSKANSQSFAEISPL